MKLRYKFSKHTTERVRSGVVLSLRKGGFEAYLETFFEGRQPVEQLVTDATVGQVALCYGNALVLDECRRKRAPTKTIQTTSTSLAPGLSTGWLLPRGRLSSSGLASQMGTTARA